MYAFRPTGATFDSEPSATRRTASGPGPCGTADAPASVVAVRGWCHRARHYTVLPGAVATADEGGPPMPADHRTAGRWWRTNADENVLPKTTPDAPPLLASWREVGNKKSNGGLDRWLLRCSSRFVLPFSVGLGMSIAKRKGRKRSCLPARKGFRHAQVVAFCRRRLALEKVQGEEGFHADRQRKRSLSPQHRFVDTAGRSALSRCKFGFSRFASLHRVPGRRAPAPARCVRPVGRLSHRPKRSRTPACPCAGTGRR